TAPDEQVTECSEAMWMRLRNALRDSYTVVRMNSGEMAVLLPSVNGPEDVVLVANKILSKLEEPLCIQGLQMQVRPRLGIALFPEHSTNANILMQRADLALTVAKQKRNPTVLSSSQQERIQTPALPV